MAPQMRQFVKTLTHLLLIQVLLMNPIWAQSTSTMNSNFSELNSCREEKRAQVDKCEGSNGRKWNCVMDTCTTKKDNDLFNQKYENCNNARNVADQTNCKAELKSIGQEIKSDEHKIKSEEFKVTEGGEAVKTIAAGLIGAVIFSTICPAPSPSSPSVAYIGAGISVVASIWNHMQAKKKMEKHQKEYKKLVAQMETNGMSVEIQIRVFRLMIQALKDMEEIADNKYKKHMIVTTLYATATAIAAVEAATFPYTFTACSILNIGALAVGTALEMNEMMKAKKMKSDYASRRSAVEKILKRFEDALLKGGMAIPPSGSELAKGNENEAIKYQKLTPENKALEDRKEQVVNADEDKSSGRVCLSKSGNEDLSCTCKETNSCFKVDQSVVKSLGQMGTDYLKSSNFSSVVNNANQLASGNTDLSELNTEKLEANLAMAMGMKKFVLKQVNEQRKLRGESEISDEPDFKQFEKAVNSMSPLERAIATRYDESNMDVNNFLQDGLEKTLESAKKTGTSVANSQNPKVQNAIEAIDIDALRKNLLSTTDLKTDSDSQSDMASNTLNDSEKLNEDEIEIKNEDIIRKPEASIFKVISNRYNLIRLEKRIGY